MAIRVISVDLDDTLWDCRQVVLNAEAVLRKWLQAKYPKIPRTYTMEEMRAQRIALAEQRPDLKHNFTELRRVSLQANAKEFGYSTEMADDAIEVFLEERNQVTLYDDVLPALERLAKDFLLIALTNGNADIEKVGLGHVFKRLISAADVGASKPDPKMFRAISQKTGVEIEEIIHIGDDPIQDIQGAHAVGMRNIWINRDAQAWPEQYLRPHAEVRTLHQLAPLVAEWHAK